MTEASASSLTRSARATATAWLRGLGFLPAPEDTAAMGQTDDSGRSEICAGVIVLFLFFGVFGGWAACAPLNAGVTAPGFIVVSGNRQAVQHRDGGVVGRLHVQDGREVARGDILIELVATEVAAQHRAAADELLELEARRARLVTELDGGSTVEPPPGWAALPDEDRARADIILSRQQTELRARQRTLEAQSGALQSQRAQLDADIASYTAQIRASRQQQTLIEEELTGLRRLADRGLVTATRLRALERAQAELIGQQQSLEAQIARAREGRSESGLQSVVLREGRAAEIGEQIGAIDLRLSELRPSLEALTARLESTRIRAPASGRVVGLAVFTEGGVISAGQRLMDIVPEQQPLVVNAQINPQDADDLRAGMEARLRFVGLHDRRTPLLTGTVQFVSADRLIDERTGQSYFTAQIAVSPEELGRLNVVDGASVAVTPGQPVEVLVPLRARTALQYMSDPLAQALWRSFREH